MHCACVLEPWSALQWFAFITLAMRCLSTLGTSSCAWSLKPFSCRSVTCRQLRIAGRNVFLTRLVSVLFICSQRLRLIIPFSPPLRCASRILLLGRYKNPSSTSRSYSLSVRGHLHSLHRFSLRIWKISMISRLLKSIQTDQKPLNEPVAVYT